RKKHMRDLLKDLSHNLQDICPVFLQLPLAEKDISYPYITIEPENFLQGLPWGPSIMTLFVKIWSRYTGTKEILILTKKVEKKLHSYTSATLNVSIKILTSALLLLK